MAGFAAYSNALPTPFKSMDDYISIVDNSAIHAMTWSNLQAIFTGSFFQSGAFYRPLVYVSFMLEYAVAGSEPLLYHVVNVFLHILAGFAVFHVLKIILRDNVFAFLGALMFVLHPIHAEAVTNIPGRSILLCGMFFLWAFYFYIDGIASKKGGVRFYLSVLCFILSLASKESAVIFPFVIVLYHGCFSASETWTRRTARNVVILFIILGGYSVLRYALEITAGFQGFNWSETFLGVMTFLNSCFGHILHLILPVNLYYDDSQLLFLNFLNPWIWVTLGIWLSVVVILLAKRQKISAMGWFCIGWAVLNMAPVSQIIAVKVSPRYISTADHFLYLSSISAFVGMIWFFRWAAREVIRRKGIKKELVSAFGFAFYIFLMLTTIQQTVYARQEIAMYNRTLEKNPYNTRVRSALATAYGLENMLPQAEREYRKVLSHDPREERARIGLGVALCKMGKCFEALKEYDKVFARGENRELLEGNRKVAIKALIFQYKLRIKEEPRNAGLHYSLGVMHARLGQMDQAKAAYEKVLQLDHGHKYALMNLANYFEVNGKTDQAIALYERMLRSDDTGGEHDEKARQRLEDLTEK